jgi:hypothetical protein
MTVVHRAVRAPPIRQRGTGTRIESHYPIGSCAAAAPRLMNMQRAGPISGFSLGYPMPLGVFDSCQQAQRVVDYLSDNDFGVRNLAIVGTDLKSVERVTGRLTRVKAAVAGANSGFWIGLFAGIAFLIFSAKDQIGFLITTPLLGAVFGLIWSQLGFTAITVEEPVISPGSASLSRPGTKCWSSTGSPNAPVNC